MPKRTSGDGETGDVCVNGRWPTARPGLPPLGSFLRIGGGRRTAHPPAAHRHRSSFRTTSLSPDHTSVTAQTLMST